MPALRTLPGDPKDPLRFLRIEPWSDASDLSPQPTAIHVTVAGNIHYTTENGITLTRAFEVGWHPIRPVRIFATGTTATLEAWWS